MPCYNAELSIKRAIKSIQAQSMADWELIVVDDGSRDGTANIVQALAAKDSRIHFERCSHEGVVAASNHGFSRSRAPLIARMDADDTSRPSRLEKQWSALQSDSVLAAVSSIAEFAGDLEQSKGYAHHVAWTNQHTTPEKIALNRFIDLPFPHPTLMYHRELVETHGGYRTGGFPEDYEMLLRWMDAGVIIGKIEEVLYDWYDPPTRLSRNDPRYDPIAFHICKAPYLKNAIIASGNGDRELWIWGAGRPARKCAAPLEHAWKPASGYIDIDPRKIGRDLHGRPVVSSNNLPKAKDSVIVSYVGTRGARDIIRQELAESGRTEGEDFWICA